MLFGEKQVFLVRNCNILNVLQQNNLKLTKILGDFDVKSHHSFVY
jgi:hypothetical protein